MASLLTHAVLGATLGQCGKSDWRKEPAFWLAAVVCSALPDIDVIGFRMGVHYGDLWGHRGVTHSLLFAAVLATGMASGWRSMAGERWKLGVLVFLITASHGLLDALTNGGLGVAFFSPFATQRYFFPWRPLLVSPIGGSAFFSPRGLRVLSNEIPWIWLPCLAVTIAVQGLRGWRRRLAASKVAAG